VTPNERNQYQTKLKYIKGRLMYSCSNRCHYALQRKRYSSDDFWPQLLLVLGIMLASWGLSTSYMDAVTNQSNILSQRKSKTRFLSGEY